MRVAVVADLVPGLVNQSRDSGQACSVSPALEERGRNIVARQDVENLWRTFARTIIERESDGGPLSRPAPVRASEHRRGAPTHGPRQEGAGRSHGDQQAHVL